MREGLHLCKSSSQLAYLLCWREREVIRTTSVLFICESKLLSPAVCSTLTSVKGKTLFLWQPLCCCNRKWLCLSSGAVRAHSHTHFIHVSPCVIFLNKYCFGVLLYFFKPLLHALGIMGWRESLYGLSLFTWRFQSLSLCLRSDLQCIAVGENIKRWNAYEREWDWWPAFLSW